MNLFEIPKWETDAAGESLNHNLFKFGPTKGKKKKNVSKISSVVDSETYANKSKKKVKNGLVKKLVQSRNNSTNKESEGVKQYEPSVKKPKRKDQLKGNKANYVNTENKLENVGKNFVTAPVSGYIKKQKKKRNRFKKMTNEDSVLSTENSTFSSKKVNYSEFPEPNALKTTPKKRKRLPSESAVPLLKSTGSSSEERIRPAKQRKLKDEINTPVGDTSTYPVESQKSPYSIQKLKEIFAKTPPNNYANKKKKNVTSTLRERMMQKLQASRFRYLNEQLYTSEPKEAQELFRCDPEAFQAYHEGYQQQVQRWPMNPLDVIIKSLKKKPSELVIADLGCGDAQLARSLPNRVHSFDLVALSDEVIACNMAHTPLSNASVDVVVFCLSLMGTSLKEFLTEANRVLKEGGLMKIAEVESRFDNVEEFIAKLQKFGFACTWKDLSHNLFYFLDFKKERSISKKMKKKLPELTLRPCLYKKR